MKFDYKEVMSLGFERQDHNDTVWFQRHGYDWFTVTKTLSDHIYLDWDCLTKEIEMIRINNQMSILSRMKIGSKEFLNELIEFFGK